MFMEIKVSSYQARIMKDVMNIDFEFDLCL